MAGICGQVRPNIWVTSGTKQCGRVGRYGRLTKAQIREASQEILLNKISFCEPTTKYYLHPFNKKYFNKN